MWRLLTLGLLKGAGFVDTFDDGARGPEWTSFQAGSTTLTEQGGRLEVRSGVSNANAYAGYITAGRYDLRDGFVQVEVVERGQDEVGWQLSMGATDRAGVARSLLLEDGTLQVYPSVDGGRRSVPLSGVRWLRIRETAGVTFLEYGLDGGSWTVLFQEPDAVAFESVEVDLQGGTYRRVTPQQTGAFDNFELHVADDAGPGDGGTANARQLRVGCGCEGASAAPSGALLALALGLLGARRRAFR